MSGPGRRSWPRKPPSSLLRTALSCHYGADGNPGGTALFLFPPSSRSNGYRIDLLKGSLSAKEKRQAHERIRSGETQIAIGTHALVQEDVEFKNLSLVVIDEQHRFGVAQRNILKEKGKHRMCWL